MVLSWGTTKLTILLLVLSSFCFLPSPAFCSIAFLFVFLSCFSTHLNHHQILPSLLLVVLLLALPLSWPSPPIPTVSYTGPPPIYCLYWLAWAVFLFCLSWFLGYLGICPCFCSLPFSFLHLSCCHLSLIGLLSTSSNGSPWFLPL